MAGQEGEVQAAASTPLVSHEMRDELCRNMGPRYRFGQPMAGDQGTAVLKDRLNAADPAGPI